MYIWVDWKRDRDSAERHTQWRRCGFSVKSLFLSALFCFCDTGSRPHLDIESSTFASRFLGHLKVPDHLIFNSLPDFREFRTTQALLYFSTLSSLPQGQHLKQPNFYKSLLPVFFVLPESKYSMVYIIFRTLTQSSWSHFLSTHYMWTRFQCNIPII